MGGKQAVSLCGPREGICLAVLPILAHSPTIFVQTLTVFVIPSAAPLSHIDDEYSQAGIDDPRVLITTSRDPSSKLAQFSKVRSRSYPRPLPSPAPITLPTGVTITFSVPTTRADSSLCRKCASASPTRLASTAETTS